MKRRILALVCIICLIFSVGCSKKSDKDAGASQDKKPGTSSVESGSQDSSENEESEESSEDTELDEDDYFDSFDDDLSDDDFFSDDDDFFSDDDEAFYTPVTKPQKTERKPLKKGINVATLQDGEENTEQWVYAPETYVLLKASGFDHVRLPINWMAFTETGSNKLSEKYMRNADVAVNAALDAGLSVVIDFHGYLIDLIGADVGSYEQKFYDMWEQIAIRYRNYPDDLYFELINEPNAKTGNDTLTADSLNRLQNNAIKIIRKYSKTRPIAVATMNWNRSDALPALDIPTHEEDPNLIISLHCYDNMNFTHQGAWWDPAYANISGVLFESSKASIKTAFDYAAEYQKKSGHEIWYSEFGVAQTGATPNEEISKYAEYFTTLCKEYGFGWCYWEYAGTFGAYDPVSEKWKDFVYDYLK